jgi:hypothetical protein
LPSCGLQQPTCELIDNKCDNDMWHNGRLN